MQPQKIRKAISNGNPLAYAEVVHQIHANKQFGLKLFKWQRDYIYSIITAETLKQFLALVKKFNIQNCHEVFAGSGLTAACLSKYVNYEASDNHSFVVKKYYYKVKKLNYQTAIKNIVKPTLVIAILPVGWDCVEILISHVTKTKPLWLIVYSDNFSKKMLKAGLSVIKLKHTVIVPGDMWDQVKNQPSKKDITNSCLSLFIYKA